MAVSRRAALLCLGTILLCFLFAAATAADSDYGDDIHAVRHSSNANANAAAALDDCKSDQPDKGDQCREENDVLGDDDFDDTYKIVNNIPLSLSAAGKILKEAEESDEAPVSEEELGNNLSILGH